jgi:transaldolase
MDSSLLFSDKELVKRMKDFILEGVDEEAVETHADPFWQNLRNLGTELWLDTGDIEEAKEIWTSEMTALTTNNTLLNKEIQKGIYDDYIKKAKEIVGKLPLQEQVIAIAFILNARHGLRLTKIFKGMVSVELHTDISYDYQAIVEFGKHYFDISPDHFLVKVPYTAVGLLGARKLRELGVKINLTLEFSARQNVLVAAIAQPNYCNVFMGRLGSYIKDNNLGDGLGAGEKAVLASQKLVREISHERKEPTRLIAASLRDASQLENLAGVDVFTMPVKVAKEGKEKLSGNFESMLTKEFQVNLNEPANNTFVEKLWKVTPQELFLARDLKANPPKDGKELIQRANEAGLKDMFPQLNEQDYQQISEDGKIPKHEHWVERIKKGELAIDTLLNLGGLASFANDQAKLDGRIKQLIKN